MGTYWIGDLATAPIKGTPGRTVIREIPLWVAREKEALGTVRKRRAGDYASARRWEPGLLPMAIRIRELEARVRELEAELAHRPMVAA